MVEGSMARITIPNDVKLKEDIHQYFHRDGREFVSVSRILEPLKPVFDREFMAYQTAKKRLSMKNIPITDEFITTEKKEVLNEWTKKNKDAIDAGNRIHNAIERFLRTAVINPEDKDLNVLVNRIAMVLSDYDQKLPEQCLYLDKAGIAGTSDIICVRKGKGKPIVDIFDFKTNLSKGIEFFDKYGKFLNYPVSHLESCNYNTYSLQLSIYAFILEEMIECTIGRLGIIYINPKAPDHYTLYPVPYMTYDAQEIMSEYEKKKVKEKNHVIHGQ